MKVLFGVLLMLSFRDSVYCQNPTTISGITQNSMRDIGSTAKLTCTVFNLMNNNISWIKVNEENDTNSIVLSTDQNVFIKGSRFSLIQDIIRKSYDHSNCYILQILKIQVSDAGVYRCRVFHKSNYTITAETKILVRSSPKIFFMTKSLVIKEGQPFKLECYASGTPTPSVAWRRKNGGTLITGETVHNGNVIEFNSITRQDAGSYYCDAKNGVSKNANHITNVIVQFPPNVTTPKPFQTPALNYNTDLLCHVEGLPIRSIVWLHNGDELFSNQYISITNLASSVEVTDSILRIFKVENHHYGHYMCRTSNDLGTAEVTITLLHPNFELAYQFDFNY